LQTAEKQNARLSRHARAGDCVSYGRGLLEIAGALLAVALAGESLFRPALLTGLQVERVPLDFFYDIFLLHFALEAA
jgi:hypothetical protein